MFVEKRKHKEEPPLPHEFLSSIILIRTFDNDEAKGDLIYTTTPNFALPSFYRDWSFVSYVHSLCHTAIRVLRTRVPL